LRERIITPFLRSVTLRPPGRRLLAVDPDIAATSFGSIVARLEADAEHESIFPPSLLQQTLPNAQAELCVLVVLRGYASRPELQKVAVFDILPIVMQQMTCRERELERMGRVMHELRGVDLYEMRLGSPGESARALKNLLDEQA
jgi:hypothetical protein